MSSTDWTTPTTTYDDGRGVRTAIMTNTDQGGSIDVLFPNGERACRINVFTYPESGNVIVDVIDVDRRFNNKRALRDIGSVPEAKMDEPHFSYLVSADLRNNE